MAELCGETRSVSAPAALSASPLRHPLGSLLSPRQTKEQFYILGPRSLLELRRYMQATYGSENMKPCAVCKDTVFFVSVTPSSARRPRRAPPRLTPPPF